MVGGGGAAGTPPQRRKCTKCHTFLSRLDAHNMCSRCRGHLNCSPHCDERLLFGDSQESDFLTYIKKALTTPPKASRPDAEQVRALQDYVKVLQAQIPGSEPPAATRCPPGIDLGDDSGIAEPLSSQPGCETENPQIIGYHPGEDGEGLGLLNECMVTDSETFADAVSEGGVVRGRFFILGPRDLIATVLLGPFLLGTPISVIVLFCVRIRLPWYLTWRLCLPVFPVPRVTTFFLLRLPCPNLVLGQRQPPKSLHSWLSPHLIVDQLACKG